MTASLASLTAAAASRCEAGRELARIRVQAGVTQRAVAAVLGVASRTVSCWEQGRWRPPSVAAERWRDVCAQAARQQAQSQPRRPGPGRRLSVVDPADLLRIREETGAARAWLAPVLGVVSRTIQGWETGRTAAPPEMAERWPQACAEAARLAAQYAAERKAARR
jgi:DNA-binding transcriptional regulator YiaG